MSMVAIIPARGGSKRIPRKNIRPFLGRPMLSYAIAVARESGLFDEVMVSTEDDEVAEIARQQGAAVPFMRSDEMADDTADTLSVMREVLRRYQEQGKPYEAFCCLYPCVPLLSAEKLAEAGRHFLERKPNMLMAAVRYAHPVQRAFYLRENGCVEFCDPGGFNCRTQDLEPAFHDAGTFYFLMTQPLLSGHPLSREAFELPECMVQDIDDENDWRLAEMKYRMINDARNRA